MLGASASSSTERGVSFNVRGTRAAAFAAAPFGHATRRRSKRLSQLNDEDEECRKSRGFHRACAVTRRVRRRERRR